MNKYWNHFKTIMRHKWYVFQECKKHGLIWQGIIHDWTKFLPSEFLGSAKYWTGTTSPAVNERNAIGASYTWRFHKGRNRHHWQWYIDLDGWDENDRVIINAAEMPDKYIKEMYCDSIATAKLYGGSAKDYYLKQKREWVLHPNTRIKYESLLGISDNGEDEENV